MASSFSTGEDARAVREFLKFMGKAIDEILQDTFTSKLSKDRKLFNTWDDRLESWEDNLKGSHDTDKQGA